MRKFLLVLEELGTGDEIELVVDGTPEFAPGHYAQLEDGGEMYLVLVVDEVH